jgi:hypothetical protein
MMARAKLNPNREAWEVGQAIVSAWFKVLSNGQNKIRATEQAELLRLFQEIFETPIAQVIVDPETETQPITMIVPQPPRTSVAELLTYLDDFHKTANRHYHEELGTALIFGCGKR